MKQPVASDRGESSGEVWGREKEAKPGFPPKQGAVTEKSGLEKAVTENEWRAQTRDSSSNGIVKEHRREKMAL